MSLVSTLPSALEPHSKNDSSNSLSLTAEVDKESNHHHRKDEHDPEAALGSLLGAFANGISSSNSMDRGAPEYSQTGLHSPYPSALQGADDKSTENQTADTSSAAHYNPQDVRSNNYSSTATPTSEYGVHPASARSGSFPEHIQRQYYPSSNHSGSSGSMAQPTSPSMPLQDGRNHQNHAQQHKSDADVPIDPSIAASSPTYPPQYGQHSPYPPQQDMSHGYPQHPGGPMYAQPRPDWAGYGQPHPQHGMPAPYPTSGVQTPTSAAPAGARPGQVSIFLSVTKSPNRSRFCAHPRVAHHNNRAIAK